ncbi:Tm-1-like ATP-binding domain-containing protein [Edaphobacter albus]|uniref:Tm-1-like ATP-binding domain-containing protein n=1 Tax=Edaphobacter sp. 4G125 TaxID=2763071 RepID=UPI001C991C8E|nr:Tm-1-like ATP-binding domain-containing protein [Edaphobacter sp. 4G125]
MTASYSILVVGTLDTKGNEVRFLRDRLIVAGLTVTVVDIGVLDSPLFQADVSREEIVRAAGESIAELVAAEDRGRATAAMHRGLAAWVRERRARGFREGMMAIGGSAGTAIATAGMRELPIGVPKLMLSTMASGDVRPYVGTSDICMMYSVVDFTGLNSLTSTILANAADAMAGMCGRRAPLPEVSSRTLLAATMFGNTTPCVNRVKELLEDRGYELLVFHATGTGGQAMERLVVEGFVKGVLDITTTELADELVGGVLTAGPHRLEAAGGKGVPQVVSVGALDMVNFGAPETVPSKFAGRLFYPHNPAVTLMRTTPQENRELGEMLARKLNRAQGPVVLLLPLRGISGIDHPGKPFYDPVADKSLFDALRANVGPNVKLVELDRHINDPEFAEAVADEFLKCAEVSSGFSVGTGATPGVSA